MCCHFRVAWKVEAPTLKDHAHVLGGIKPMVIPCRKNTSNLRVYCYVLELSFAADLKTFNFTICKCYINETRRSEIGRIEVTI